MPTSNSTKNDRLKPGFISQLPLKTCIKCNGLIVGSPPPLLGPVGPLPSHLAARREGKKSDIVRIQGHPSAQSAPVPKGAGHRTSPKRLSNQSCWLCMQH
ncbi:unnamed protein product [Protopolystoma xenopodis]|uniref:Uncharacterized protein n=1 Tax=Protopolystoma xenopodis TaxID=117903 RepID=A0A3S5AT38_9PLAT|nr:unnamed protein product [Protopolystoma xenopodis]